MDRAVSPCGPIIAYPPSTRRRGQLEGIINGRGDGEPCTDAVVGTRTQILEALIATLQKFQQLRDFRSAEERGREAVAKTREASETEAVKARSHNGVIAALVP